MLTFNPSFEESTEVFGSERLTGALLDWLTHRCHILEANGEGYRLRQARKRPKHRPPQDQSKIQKELQE
jgi:DNA replication protein DnaC